MKQDKHTIGRWLLAGSMALFAALAQTALATANLPAGQIELKIPSHGAHLNGFIYTAEGPGPHPVMVFLHGFPGNERNLDLAQAVRRVGWDAVYFDYRGSWGSGGQFSFAHSAEDVQSVLAYLRTPEQVQRLHLDPTRIALLGHSMGGGLALLTAENDPAIRCTVALAAWNFGAEASAWTKDSTRKQQQLDYFGEVTDPDSGPLHTTAAALGQELLTAPPSWDVVAQAEHLRRQPVLLVADTRTAADMATYQALLARVQSLGINSVTSQTYVDDHPFSAHRQALAELLLPWLDSHCGGPLAVSR